MRFNFRAMTFVALAVVSTTSLPLFSQARTQKQSALNKIQSKQASVKVTSLSQKSSVLLPLSSSTITASQTKNTDKAQTSIISGSLGATGSTNLYDHQDGSRNDGLDYELNLAYILNPKFSLAWKSGYSQNLKDSEVNDFTDSVLSFRKSPTELGSYILFSPSTSALFATSKRSRNIQNLQMGLRLGGSFSLNPVMNPNLSLGISLSGGQNFHDYETDVHGRVLNKYSVSQGLSAGYTFGKFSLSFIFNHKNAWSYQGNMIEAFEHFQDLSYSISKRFSVSVGHTNSGSALKANGEDSNIALIDENSSVVYSSLTLNF